MRQLFGLFLQLGLATTTAAIIYVLYRAARGKF